MISAYDLTLIIKQGGCFSICRILTHWQHHCLLLIVDQNKNNLNFFSISFSNRSTNKGEREPEACGGGQDGPGTGRRHQWTLQHHLLCHAGGDPALPPHPRAWLQGTDAASLTAADHLLPENHREAGGGFAEIRQRVTHHFPKLGGLDLGLNDHASPSASQWSLGKQWPVLQKAVDPAGRKIHGENPPVIMTFQPNPGLATIVWDWVSLI